jgi:hypothetical protein
MVAATLPPSVGVGAVVGGSLPPCRPEPSKSLWRHSVPGGRVPPRPAASVGASVASRRPLTGAVPLPPGGSGSGVWIETNLRYHDERCQAGTRAPAIYRSGIQVKSAQAMRQYSLLIISVLSES